MANTVPYGRMLHTPPTNYQLLDAEEEQYQKALILMKNTEEFPGGKKSRERHKERWE